MGPSAPGKRLSGEEEGADPMPEDRVKRRSDTLNYLQSMLGQLRVMAEAERCDMLAYLIEMAYVEASDIVRGDRPLRVGEDKRNGAS